MRNKRYRGPQVWYELGDAHPIVAYQPALCPTYRDSLLNLPNRGVKDAAPGTAPTWAKTGWAFNGSTQYLKTGIVPDANTSFMVQFTGAGATGYFMGVCDGAGNKNMVIGPPVYYAHGGGVEVRLPALATGNLGVAGLQGYRNGVADGAALTGGAIQAVEIYIACRNANGAPANRVAATVRAMVICSITITAQQLWLLYCGMSDLEHYGYWKRRPTFWPGYQAAAVGSLLARLQQENHYSGGLL